MHKVENLFFLIKVNQKLIKYMTPSITYLVPILNEESNIESTVKGIADAFKNNILKSYEIVFIDDGSIDNSVNKIKSLIQKKYPIKCICLTRNFGHQAALTAGMQYANSKFIAILDGDLQDPPEVINQFLEYANKGFDIIYGVRKKRKESLPKRFAYGLFYKILANLSNINIPLDSGDFCLITKEALEKLNKLPEENRFIRGLRSYIGLNQIGIEYERGARFSGEPKYNFSKLIRLASDGIFNFSDRPLKITSALGFFLFLLSLVLMIFLVIQRIFSIEIFGYSPNDVPGYTSLIISNIFLSGIQLFALGIIGEYISRIFIETKKRPSFLIREIIENTKENN